MTVFLLLIFIKYQLKITVIFYKFDKFIILYNTICKII